MLIVEVKHNESISQALKRYKRKYRNTRILRELRERKEYIKPSVRRRAQKLRAIYRNQKAQNS